MADLLQEVEECKNCFVWKRDELVTPAHEWVTLAEDRLITAGQNEWIDSKC